MPVIQHPFSGMMDLDTPDYNIAPSSHRSMRNMIFRGSKGNMRAESQLGTNSLFNTYLPNTGVNKCIGVFFDAVNKRVFFFNYNSLGNHGIYIYNTVSGIFQRLIQSGINTDGDILAFNADIYITSIDIIYADNEIGDILEFVDSLGRPTQININKYLSGLYSNIKRDYIDVAKAPPQMPVKAVYETASPASSLVMTVSGDNSSTTVSFSGTVTSGISLSVTSTLYGTGKITIPTNPSNTWSFTTGSVTSIYTLVSSIIASFSSYTVSYMGSPIEPFEVVDLGGGTIRITPTALFSAGTMQRSSSFSDPSVASTITANNLRNKLFKFRYRFVYDNYEKSVWGAASETPLPNQDSSVLTVTNSTLNSRIALYFSTGDINVIKIELAVQITENGVVSDWQLLDSLDKSVLGINSNTVYERYLFYNNSTLIPIPLDEINQLYDYVPLSANCMALLNGNVLAYGGITEGYNIVPSNQSIIDTIVTSPSTTYSFCSVNGVLFFAQINGIDSGSQGTQITFYLTGTGTNNSAGNPSTLDSGFITGSTVKFTVNMFSGVTDLSQVITLGTSVSTNLSNLSTALTGAGFSVVNSTDNSLTVSYGSTVTLLSSGISTIFGNINGSLPFYSYVNHSTQYFGIQYFDNKGRTNGVVTNIEMKVKFPLSSYSSTFSVNPMWCQLVINQRPPTWASYYQIVRSNNLTYSKLLYWVSCQAGSDTDVLTGQRYAYIGISNINDYNKSIESTQGVIGYDFTQGDRISFYGRFTDSGAETSFTPNFYDYEILGTVVNPTFGGIVQTGNFIKIAYPTSDIGSNLKFDNTNPNYQNYEIIIYGIKDSVAANQTTFYEFGKCFGIGNYGTDTAYHIGLEQTQTSDLSLPAKISIENGDYFFRKRNVITSTNYQLSSPSQGFGDKYLTPAFTLVNMSSPQTTTNYTVQNSTYNGDSSIPTDYTSGRSFFLNNSASGVQVRVRCTIPLNCQANGSTQIFLEAINSGGTYQLVQCIPSQSTVINTDYNIVIDKIITVQSGGYLRMLIANPYGGSSANIYIQPFQMSVDVISTYPITVFDASFSDYANLQTNSNGRPTVIDVNATQSFNGSLIRWSRPREIGTNINQTNNFFALNYDEVAKQYGSLTRIITEGQRLKIFQNRKCGVKGIFNKYIKNTQGQTQLIVTDDILTKNNTEYYEGDFGIGNEHTAICHNGYQFYFFDNVKGYLCRLSLNGVDAISEEFKVQTWAGSKLPKYNSNYTYQYGGNAKLIAVYNFLSDRDSEVLFMTQGGTNGSDTVYAETLSFVERNNSFPSYYDYAPDNAICAENTLYLWNNGIMYIQNNNTSYCNYFGNQFKPSLTKVFNDFNEVKKTWISVSVNSNIVFNCPSIYTQLYSHTNTAQQSVLFDENFKSLEGIFQASFLRDSNSRKGLINGDSLKGTYIVIQFSVTDGSKFVYLIMPSVKYIISQLTNK